MLRINDLSRNGAVEGRPISVWGPYETWSNPKVEGSKPSSASLLTRIFFSFYLMKNFNKMKLQM